MSDKYVSRKVALDKLGISPMTLLKLANEKKIELIKTPGGQRKYNIEKYISENKQETKKEIKKETKQYKINEIEKKENNTNKKINICYVRVSTYGQKDDLERQKKYMLEKYPEYELIEDIGSGINFNRKGLRRIVKMAIEGKINKLVVAYKDRLTRFGYDLIEDLIREYSGGQIIIENEKEERKEPKEELVDDVLQILNVYTAKMNGLRKYRKNVTK